MKRLASAIVAIAIVVGGILCQNQPVIAADIAANTVLDNPTVTYPTASPSQHKTFFANTRYWVFFSDGTDMAFCSSADGSSWSAKTTVRVCAAGMYFSTWTDGTYVYYTHNYPTGWTPEGDIFWRRGTLNADGTIAWGTERQAVEGVPGSHYYGPNICLDSNGHAVISYWKLDGHIYVTRNANTDDTWSTEPGFPLDVGTGSHYTQPVPLTGGKVLIIYPYSSEATVRSRVLSGTTLSTERATTSNVSLHEYAYDAVSRGNDDVDMVFQEATSLDLVHTIFDYSDNAWESETNVRAAAADTSIPTLSWNAGDPSKMYCFWFNSPTENHLYYKEWVSGSWDADPTDWLTETSPQAYFISSSYQNYNNHVEVIWPADSSSPYKVRFAALDTSPASNRSPAQPTNVSPSNAVTGMSLTPTLQSSAFSDPDVGDTHATSQWQIRTSTGSYSTPAYDSGSTATNLTSITLPLGALTYSTTYYWRVSHQANHGDWSEWSAETSFEVGAEEPPQRTSSKGVPWWVWVVTGLVVTSLGGTGLAYHWRKRNVPPQLPPQSPAGNFDHIRDQIREIEAALGTAADSAFAARDSLWLSALRLLSDDIAGLSRSIERGNIKCEEAEERILELRGRVDRYRNPPPREAGGAEPKSRKAPPIEELVDWVLKVSRNADGYEVLGVSRSAMKEDVDMAFKKKQLGWHPDKFPSADDKKLANAVSTRLNNARDQIYRQRGWK